MLLSQLKDYIQSAKQITLAELSIQLKEDSSTIHAMMQHLIHKGLVIEKSKTMACKAKCTTCYLTTQLTFCWQ